MMINRILIAVNKTELGHCAAEVGMHLAQRIGADCAWVHVVNTHLAVVPGVSIDAGALLAELRQDGRGLLASMESYLPAGIPRPREFLPEGDPATEIIRAAAEWPADLIVMGTHGRGRMAHLILGSTSEAVLRKARCPVLLVPHKE